MPKVPPAAAAARPGVGGSRSKAAAAAAAAAAAGGGSEADMEAQALLQVSVVRRSDVASSRTREPPCVSQVSATVPFCVCEMHPMCVHRCVLSCCLLYLCMQLLLQEQKLQEARALENTIEFQEALIEERDHGIAGEGREGWAEISFAQSSREKLSANSPFFVAAGCVRVAGPEGGAM